MASESPDLTTTEEDLRREEIRSALSRDFDEIARAIGAMVYSYEKGRDRAWRNQRIEDVLAEAVFRALERPTSYDPSRSFVTWVVGIANNVIRGEARVAASRPRRADLDEAAWESVLAVLDPELRRTIDHLEIERMLSRLNPQQRKAIECGYLRELGGDELVEALGSPSQGAARIRVFRAVQALRDLYSQDGSEVAL